MIITQTPLRISLAGGGSDFPEFFRTEGGAVVSLAIDKYLYVIVKERFDDRIYVNYSVKEIVDHVDDLRHDLVREAMRRTGITHGVEITTLSDVPSEGTGLGSSGSVTVGLLNAFYAYQGMQAPAERLAREACEIEIDLLKKPIGVQDQYIAAYGNLRFFQFGPADDVRVERIPVPEARKRALVSNLLLFFTNRTRPSEAILDEQRRNIPERLAEIRGLRAAAFETRSRLLDGGLAALGPLLHRCWQQKRRLAPGVSSADLDALYERARAAGATGGKLTGAGGGGFLLLYCPWAAQAALRSALGGYRELPFTLEPDGSKVIFNIRRSPWT
ncbi:MAG: GHMP kinase [Elusimicrobia bacterium GWA2_69_24]|nr:MAG: GHMP kinase [Candidatus Rokubacteria bacterium GWC2_70_16]OGK91842.1 MAG: GHMP kinase [Candidatus Rokubacteria bacterium RBG_16_73_20]OGR57635.1 MAG: GHMP kinase [Elusimicrobia bacterium GWA2_69_24]HBH02520.1 GHMP kinase [Candidatus Rokubacteria bacterium]